MEGTAGSTFAPPAQAASPLLVGGASRATEWGRKGVNLVRMGWRSPPVSSSAPPAAAHTPRPPLAAAGGCCSQPARRDH